MNQYIQDSLNTEQNSKILFQMTELALSESAGLLSSLGQNKVRLVVDSIGVYDKNRLEDQMNSTEAEMLAVCHPIEGRNSGQIIFIIEDSEGLFFTKELLHDKTYLKEMSEMEEESFMEVGNIIVNDLLSHYVEVLHKSVKTSIPFLKRGHYSQLFDQLCREADKTACYIVSITVELSTHSFKAYVWWVDHLCGLDETDSKYPPNPIPEYKG